MYFFQYRFFPNYINYIELSGFNYSILWAMPILPKEAQFIKNRGIEEFEQRLDDSPYGYFDIREDAGYLDCKRHD